MKQEAWVPSNGIKMEQAALDAINCDNNSLIIAGPGAGKTELLAQKAGFLFTTDTCRFPKKILAISFKKDAADNLRDRIVERYGEEYKDRFISLTYDAFFKNILDRFFRALPEPYSLNPEYMIVDDETVKNTLLNAGCTNLTRMRDYEARKYASSLIKGEGIPTNNLLLNTFWMMMLQGTQTQPPGLSFNMISMLCLLLLRTNSYIKKLICATYSHVFLDEFQDTTGMQYSIVKELFKNSNVKVTAVGDNKQRIMLWAGALKTVFADYQGDFSASVFRLIMNHRSAPKLVELQKNMALQASLWVRNA